MRRFERWCCDWLALSLGLVLVVPAVVVADDTSSASKRPMPPPVSRYMSPMPTSQRRVLPPKPRKRKASARQKTPVAKPKKTSQGYKTMTLLARRLRVEVPASAFRKRRAIRQRGGVQNMQEREDRLILFSRKDRTEMILMASDMFATITPDFQKKVIGFWKKRMRGVSFSLQVYRSKHGVTLYELIPSKISPETSLIRAGYVVQKDKSMQFVACYGSEKLTQSKNKGVAVATRVLRSLRPGSRKLSLKGGTKAFALKGSKLKLQVQVPPKHYALLQSGRGYQTLLVQRFTTFGTPEPTLKIHVVKNPSYFYKRVPPKGLTLTHAQLVTLGYTAQWARWTFTRPDGKSAGFVMKEAMIPMPRAGKDLQAHIVLSLATKDLNRESLFTKIASTLRLVSGKK